MKKIYLIIIIDIFLIFSIFSKEVLNLKKITLDDFIIKAGKNSQFKEILTDELKLVYQEKLETPSGDLILNLLGEYNFAYLNNAFHGFKGEVSLSKLFALSGTNISGGYNTVPGVMNTQTSTVNIQIEQLIIQDAFGRSSRAQKKIAGYETEIARYQIIESYEEYLAALISLYFDWYSAYENLKNAEKALVYSNNLYENTVNKQKYNIALPIDVNKSELQVIAKKEQLISLKTTYNAIVYKIRQIINYHDNDDLVPEFILLINESINNFDEIFDFFQKESRFALTLNLIKKNSNLSLKISFDDLLPNAKLYGGYSFKGSNYFFEDNKTHNIELGINMSIPILDQNSRSTYQMKKIEVNKTNLSNANKILDMKISLKTLIDRINSEIELIKLADRKIKLSETVVKEELKNYNNGKSSLDDLINVYNSFYSNNLEKINRNVMLNKYYIEWLRLSDKLIYDNKRVQILN